MSRRHTPMTIIIKRCGHPTGRIWNHHMENSFPSPTASKRKHAVSRSVMQYGKFYYVEHYFALLSSARGPC